MLSSRGGATTLLCVVLAGGGWVLSMPELFAGGMALAAVIVLSLLWVWFPANKPTLSASASPNPAHAATTVTITTTVTGRNIRPLLLTANISDGRSVRLWTRTGRKQSQTGSFPLPVPVRGRLSIGPFKVMIVDPLGLARRTLNATSKVEVHVRPRVHECQPVPLSSAAASQRLEREPSAARANAIAGTEPAGLRSYVVGDELRLVHWTASARGRGLMVRTFDNEHAMSSVILFDDRASIHTAESFEFAIEVVASMLRSSSDRHAKTQSEPMLILWSAVAGGDGGSLLVGTEAMDRLIDIEPSKLTRVADEMVPAADVLVTGPFSTRNHAIETNAGCLRLRVDPVEHVQQLEHGPVNGLIERPGQLTHWTELAW